MQRMTNPSLNPRTPTRNLSDQAGLKTIQQVQLLRLHRLPACLYPAEAAVLLNIQPADLTKLVAARLLRPLGQFGDHDHPRYSSHEILARSEDHAWLDKVARAIYASRRQPKKAARPDAPKQS